ncbi:ferric reductase-like transmembrane domain-containing protein [Agarivorans sp. Alg241-V36]|uniref:ferredoxin reductase family protein n=1 Tax=Agarivorans sp. Alg241-V36 TaxID=2305992 RepID=UPI0013D8D195|nr:ferric reductase-like transmembrane domain-containing protein [Agarivorans sp. Alg241-V36]
MRKTSLTILLVIATVTGLWLQAEPNIFSADNFFKWRSALIQYSGILTIALMSLTMLLALRLPFIEQLTKGLDKSYRLHKHLGIASVVLATTHWLLAIIPKQLVKAGLLDKPVKGSGPNNPDSLYALIRPLRELAEQVGELAFYGIALLVLVALLGAIRYRGFRYSHKLMSLAFLALAFHSAILIKHSYWPYPITLIALSFIWVGCVAAVYSLFGRIGKSKQHNATVSQINYLAKDKVLDLRLAAPSWSGHHSGQFAFVQVAGEEPHPFTIASSAKQNGQLRFLIKELGDFTSSLKNRLSLKQKLRIEGPYGQFDFKHPAPQVWIAGGIGIAAFKAIIEERQLALKEQVTHLYYCADNPDQQFIDELKQQTSKANIQLHIVNSASDPLLSVEQLHHEVIDLMQRTIWFCGPIAFSKALKNDLAKLTFNLNNYHEELFELR